MPEVIKISDNPSLAKTKDYPYAKWKFDEFNPIQSRLVEIYEKDANVAIAASTAAGKTICSEIFMAYDIRKRGGKAIYVGPLKALAKEKEQDWTSDKHHFHDLNIAIATGDHRLTMKRIKEMDESNIVVMTPEMLASRCRNHKSDKSRFLYDVQCVVFDESHLLTVPKRGDHIEVALMKLTEINPEIRIVLLSATMPNVDEICGWTTKLTGRDTYYLESEYRPCPLSIHYETYFDGDKDYWEKESSKVGTACAIVEYYPKDKFLIFVHTIETGHTMVKSLARYGVQAEFHNGTRDAKTRYALENKFKNDKDFRVLVATSTLAWGCYRHGSRISGEYGRPVKVETVRPGDLLYCPVGNRFEHRKVVKTEDFEAKAGYRVKLESGQEAVVSVDHLFLAAASRKSPGWVKVSEMAKGDYVAVPSDLGVWSEPSKHSSIWYLRGFAFGDGSVCRCGTHADGETKVVIDLCLGVRDEYADTVVAMFNKLFGTAYIMRDDTNGIPHLVTKKRSIADKFLSVLPIGRRNGDHDLAPNLWHKTRAANFLSGWFDSDGGVESHSNGNCSVGLSSISKMAIESAQSMLLCFGITSSVGRKRMKDTVINGREQKARRKWSYRLRIFGPDNLKKFFDRIGFLHPRKKAVLQIYLDGICDDKYTKDIIPARELLVEHAKVNLLTPTNFKMITGSGLWNCVNKQDCRRDTLKKLLDATKVRTALNDLVEMPYRWSRVKEVEACDGGTFREIEVEDPHAYVGCGMVSHNCNLPARRVIVTGVHRGLMEVENYDIQQMVGRAGRPKFDPRGDAYILVPESQKDDWIRRLKTKPAIKSTLLNFVGKAENPHYKVLAFHIVAEIHQGNVKTKDGFHEWFKKSLAHFQDQTFDDAVVDKTIELLEQCRAIVTEESHYECTAVGKIASMFYYSPFDVSDLRRNFNTMFDEKKEGDDFALSISMGNIDSYRWTICNKFEKEAIATYQGKIEKMYGKGKFTDGVIKHGAAFYFLLKGRKDITQIASLQGMLLHDMERTMQVLTSLDSMSCKWDRLKWFKTAALRFRYGVESDLVELCQIPNVAAVRAKNLKAKRIKTIEDFISYDAATLASIMKCGLKVAQESLEAAKLIQLKDSLS